MAVPAFDPKKPSYINFNGARFLTSSFREELYSHSRINYSRRQLT